MAIEEKTKLSDEALGAVMMCLQKCIMDQSDIVPMLKNLDFTTVNDELFVLNPPIVKFDVEEIQDTEDLTDDA
tara:strand:- start:46975 stop:47193 length:219 start_codon:yes stop_codon:yes gene_type:complete